MGVSVCACVCAWAIAIASVAFVVIVCNRLISACYVACPFRFLLFLFFFLLLCLRCINQLAFVLCQLRLSAVQYGPLFMTLSVVIFNLMVYSLSCLMQLFCQLYTSINVHARNVCLYCDICEYICCKRFGLMRHLLKYLSIF